MLVLGLETSCDETAVGIVDAERRILANRVASQLAEHRPYGGVVPEIAARAHLDRLDDLIRLALEDAEITLADLAGIAATCGPGLIGGVMVGAMTGKAIAAVRKLPFIAVNHLEAHALTPRLTHDVAFPYLLLLVSGGHCQLLLVGGVGDYRLLGTTIDDAVGECFDKGAKLLGLGYPGGPLIERAAAGGDAKALDLPRPMLGRAGCDFSFSGLKTALRQRTEQMTENRCRMSESEKIFLTSDIRHPASFIADAAASLQAVIADILFDRTRNALELLAGENQKITALVASGGVAANGAIRARLLQLAGEEYGLPFVAPPPELCTDNGAMVAWAGLERLRLGLTDGLDAAARPRWPLDPEAKYRAKA
jgi:N6-L-threonylcarbamoyladenine synthase